MNTASPRPSRRARRRGGRHGRHRATPSRRRSGGPPPRSARRSPAAARPPTPSAAGRSCRGARAGAARTRRGSAHRRRPSGRRGPARRRPSASTARSTRPQTPAKVVATSAGMSAKESKWAREASHTDPGSPVAPGLWRVHVRSDQIRFESESALQGKQGSPPSSPRRGGSGTTRSAGSITVSGSAYGRVMLRASATAPRLRLTAVADRDQVGPGQDERRCDRLAVRRGAVAQDRVVGELDPVDDPRRVEHDRPAGLLGVGHRRRSPR